MRAIIEPPPSGDAPPRPLVVRLAWFAGLAIASAGVTATVAYLLKAVLR